MKKLFIFLLILSVFALISCEYLGFVDEGERHPYDPANDGGGDQGYQPQWEIYAGPVIADMTHESQLCMEFYGSDPLISYVDDSQLYAMQVIDPGQNMPLTFLTFDALRYTSMAYSTQENTMYLVSASETGFPQLNRYDGSSWSGWTFIDDTNSTPWPTRGISSLAINNNAANPVAFFFQTGEYLYFNGNYNTPYDLTSPVSIVDTLDEPADFPVLLSIDSAYDQDNRLHVVYVYQFTNSGITGYELKHAWQDSALAWQTEFIPLPGIAESLAESDVSIAISGYSVHVLLGVSHPSTGDFAVIYQYKANDSWLDTATFPAVMSIDINNVEEFMPDIAVDQSGMVHAVFWHQNSQSSDGFISYARIENGNWLHWDVERSDYWNQIPRPCIRIRDDGTVHLVYLGTGSDGLSQKTLKYARLTN